MSVTFFDVDGTLVRGSTGMAAARYLYRIGWIGKRQMLRAGYFVTLHYLGLMDYEQMYRETGDVFVGRSLEEVETFARGCFQQMIRPNIYQQALSEISAEREKGQQVVLASAGPRYVVEVLGKVIGVEAVLTSGLVVQNGVLTCELERPIGYGWGKVELAQTYVTGLGGRVADATFYSDSISDLPLLERVGRPVVVNPDPRLAVVAHRRGWEVLEFGAVLGREPSEPPGACCA